MRSFHDWDMLSLPAGAKPHLRPRFDCPPGNVYVMREGDRTVVVYPAFGGRNLGFAAARDVWRPWTRDTWLRKVVG